MRKTIGRILPALAALVVMMTTVGCDVDHPAVPTPPDGTFTAEGFVSYFNTQMVENRFRVEGWAGEGRVFRLRLANIRVGDDTLLYGYGGWFTDSDQALVVECSFNDTTPVRKISNGDTVDIAGRTTEADRKLWRIVLKMRDCVVDRVVVEP